MAHDVFISYSTKDKIIADAVCAKLEENKIRVWIAPRDVPAGSNFGASIIKAINSCKVFVLIWSAHTNTSEHIMNEVNQAFDQGITIIPFRIQDIQPTDEMRYYFGRTHWLDAINPPLENHIAVLRNTILTNLGREIPADIPILQPDKAPEITTLEKEPISEKVEAVGPPVVLPPSRKIVPETDENDQKQKPASKNLSRFIPYAAGGLAVIALVILGISGVFKGVPPADTAQTLPSLTKTIAPTKTKIPTPTSTPVPAWVEEANAWADPILSVISYQSPGFSDDFSTADPGWISDPNKMVCDNKEEGKHQIAEGVMTFGIGPDCRYRTVTHPNMIYNDFVVQMDLDFQDAGDFNWSSYIWPVNPLEGESFQAFGFYLNPSRWRIEVWDSTTENVHDVMSGNTQSTGKNPVSFMVIHQDRTFLYYLDSVLVASYTHEANMAGPFDIRLGLDGYSENDTGVKTVAVDNVRVWDLDDILLPERILAAIEYQSPDFADDFSNALDPSWEYYLEVDQISECPGLDDAAMAITDGVMQLRIGPDCQQHHLISKKAKFSTDYVLQMDIDFQQAPSIAFGIEPGDETLAMDIQGGGTWNLGSSGKHNGRFDPSQPLKITMILYGDTQLIYLGSTLVASQTNLPAFSEPLNLYFHIYGSEDLDLSDLENVGLDNIKIWDINELFIPELILGKTDTKEPNFVENFSQVDSAWIFSPETPGENMGCYNSDDVMMDISNGSLKYSIVNCRVGNLAYSDMVYANYVMQLDVNFHDNPMGLEIRNWNRSPLDDEGMLDFVYMSPGGNAGFQTMKFDDVVDNDSGIHKTDFSKPVTLTIINKSPFYFVYVNSILVIDYSNQEMLQGPFEIDFTINQWDYTPMQPLTLEIDNVKIWDLDKIEY